MFWIINKREMMPMIKVIAGAKGTGKTAQLVDDINEQAVQENNNIVCIERGNRLDRLLKYKIRLIDVDEYPCEGYEQLLSFVAGITAKDYDLTHIYIDSAFKVAKDNNVEDLAAFITKLDKFLSGKSLDATIICSSDVQSLPAEIQKFC
jgi:hypothetical protein